MRIECAPATIVACIRVPDGTTREAFAGWVEAVTQTGVPVTWVARRADLGAVTAVLGPKAKESDVALALDPAHFEARPTLRGELTSAREIAGDIECAVVSGVPPLDHRSLLVEQGIHTIAVGGFDGVTRSSRRPAPSGWPCRSIVWGLWEVRTVSQPPSPALGRLLPWAFAPRLTPGSLTVVHVEPGASGARAALLHTQRLTGWMARQSLRARAARLSDLPDLLGAAGQRDTGSVLRRAA